MYRSLRFQLIAIVVLTVAGVLILSQSVDTRLSERALEQDMQSRALLVLRTVDSLWGRTDEQDLRRQIEAIVEGDREIVAIDVFRLDRGSPVTDLSVNETAGTPASSLSAAELAEVTAGRAVTRTQAAAEGHERLRLTAPLRREGRIVGAVQVQVWAAAITLLKEHLRGIHTVFRIAAITLISLALAWFLERRVGRPIAALVDGMRRAEGGELGVRVGSHTGGELGFLTHSFNRMLSRLEELASGLEERVRSATHDLAEKNQELRIVNEKLWKAQREIASGERFATLGQMAGTLAHELGTPLNSVLGYVQLLERAHLQPAQAEKLEIVESQVRRMIDTIRSVLDRTRDAPLQRAPVVVGPLVAEVLQLVSTQVAGRPVTMQLDIAPDLPAVVGEAVGLRQVVLNLLTNAIDAVDGTGLIRVRAVAVPADGQHGPMVELTVEDNGRGMSAEEQRRAIEPFYTTKAPGRGTGLGLAIVEHIVRAHGGTLTIDSAPKRGTTVRIRVQAEA